MRRDDLIGAWLLDRWVVERPDGSAGYPFGDNGTGQLIYDRTGRLSVHLRIPGAARFVSDDLASATPEEMAAAWPRYLGYWGTWHLDHDVDRVVHRIEGSTFPNLVGATQGRAARLMGVTLTLSATEAWGAVVMTWTRAAYDAPGVAGTTIPGNDQRNTT